MVTLNLNYSVNTAVSGVTSGSAVNSLASSSTGQPVKMTVAQAKTALNSGNLPDSVVIRDTSANVQNQLDELGRIADLGKLADVVFTNKNASLKFTKADQLQNSGLMTAVSEAKFTASGFTSVDVDASTADTLWSKGLKGLTYNISDTVVGVKSQVDTMFKMFNANKLGIVNIEGEPSNSLVLSAVQASGGFLGKLVPSANPKQVEVEVIDTARNYDINKANLYASTAKISKVHITDTAENISGVLKKWSDAGISSTYAGQLDSISVRNSSPVTLTATQALDGNLVAALGAGQVPARIQVADTALNLVTNMVGLESLRGTYGTADAVKLVAKDTAANIKANFANLEGLYRRGALNGVVATDTSKVMTLNVKELMGNPGVVSLYAANGGTVKLSDSAATISANIDDIQQYVAAKVITAKSGGIVVNDSKALNLTLGQYGSNADVRALLKNTNGSAIVSDSVKVKLGNANNVVTSYRNNIAGITAGDGDDVVYARASKDLLVDLGAGNDMVFLEGNREDWTVVNLGSSTIYRRALAGEIGSLEQTPAPDTLDQTTADFLNGKITLESTVDSNDPSVYQFTNTSGKKVTVMGGERFGFFGSAALLAKGTVNLLA